MSQEAERVYTINLGKVLLSQSQHRSVRAINMIREFARKHMKTESIKIEEEVAHKVWARGVRRPPRKIRVRMSKTDEGHILVSLYDEDAEPAVVAKEEPAAGTGPEDAAPGDVGPDAPDPGIVPDTADQKPDPGIVPEEQDTGAAPDAKPDPGIVPEEQDTGAAPDAKPDPGTAPDTSPDPGTAPDTSPDPGTAPDTSPDPGTAPDTSPDPGTAPDTTKQTPDAKPDTTKQTPDK